MDKNWLLQLILNHNFVGLQFESIVSKSRVLMGFHNTTVGFWINVVILKIFVMCFFGFCMVPFTLLKYKLWLPVYSEIYFCGFAVFGLFPFYAPLLKWAVRLTGTVKDPKEGAKAMNGVSHSNGTSRVKSD